MDTFQLGQAFVEVASAILCFVLVRFMVKPYELTRKTSYLGLPLGFSFLGFSYALTAVIRAPFGLSQELIWFPILMRTFTYVFLAIAYFFSNRWSKKGQLLGVITISLIALVLAVFVSGFVAPGFVITSYLRVYFRIINIVCLVYLIGYTLNRYIEKPTSTAIWIPFGFIFLALSQYTLIFWYVDLSFLAYIGGIVNRFIGLSFFLYVAYRTFHRSDKTDDRDEKKDSA